MRVSEQNLEWPSAWFCTGLLYPVYKKFIIGAKMMTNLFT